MKLETEFRKIHEKAVKERKERRKKYGRVKCDCGHYMKDHYAEAGCCDKCGCTWYWPNYRYIMKKKKEVEEIKEKKK